MEIKRKSCPICAYKNFKKSYDLRRPSYKNYNFNYEDSDRTD